MTTPVEGPNVQRRRGWKKVAEEGDRAWWVPDSEEDDERTLWDVLSSAVTRLSQKLRSDT